MRSIMNLIADSRPSGRDVLNTAEDALTVVARRDDRAGHLSRRAFATAAAATVAGTASLAALAVPEPEDPDAALLDLFHQWQSAEAREEALDTSATDEELFAATGATDAIEYRIQGIRARTLAGLAVKATFADAYVEEPSPEHRLLDDIVDSLVQDAVLLGAGQIRRGSP